MVCEGKDVEIDDPSEEAIEVQQQKGVVIELPRHSMVGINSPKIMKMLETISGISVVALVDCGATHNFLF